MASMTPRKTSMKLRSVPRPLHNSLKFVEQNAVTIADRDYGLMRITAASGTPHPRVLTGVSMAALKERLEEEQQKTLIANIVESETQIDLGIQFRSNSDRSHKKIRLTDTPHPAKGTNVDPKLFVHHITASTVDGITTWSTTNRFSELTDTYSARYSPLEPSTVQNNIPIIKTGTGTKYAKKKVTLITPKMSAIPYTSKELQDSSSSDSLSQLQYLSFNERRRIFNEGEFTIAKNGKKMSDNLMPFPSKPIYIEEFIDCEGERAKAEMDLYIRNKGFIMAPTGTLTNLRRFSSQLSKRSLPSKRTSVQSTLSSLDTMKKKKKSSSLFKS